MDIKSPTGPPSPPLSDPITTTDLPPPSYGDSITPSDSKSQTHRPSSNENEKKQQQQQQPPAFAPLNPHTTAYSDEIQNQIANLSINISAVRVQKNLLNAANDQKILNYLTRAIEVYLGDFAQSQLRQGTLILIPLAAFPDPQALPSNFDLSLPASFDKVVRVSAPSPSPSLSTTVSTPTTSTTKSEPDYDFSFDTPSSKYEEQKQTEQWYWKNAAQAQRIATYLTPPKKPLPPRSSPPATTSCLPTPQSTNTPTPTPTKRTFGGFLRKKISSSTHPSSSGHVSTPSTRVEEVQEEEGDRVEMKVSAEELLFRTEDEFGIFETEMGWAVVLRLNVISS